MKNDFRKCILFSEDQDLFQEMSVQLEKLDIDLEFNSFTSSDPHNITLTYDVYFFDNRSKNTEDLNLFLTNAPLELKDRIIIITQIDKEDSKTLWDLIIKENIRNTLIFPFSFWQLYLTLCELEEKLQMRSTIYKVKKLVDSSYHTESSAILTLGESDALSNKTAASTAYEPFNKIEHIIKKILSDLGIAGETGSDDLILLSSYLIKNRSLTSSSIRLKKIYVAAVDSHSPQTLKAMEQRIRRTIKQSMIQMAHLGLMDNLNPIFEHYSNKFFDISDIWEVITDLKNNRTPNPRINIRKFIFSLAAEAEKMLENE